MTMSSPPDTAREEYDTEEKSMITPYTRQWPEVYDLCHTFLHFARVKKPTAMRESRVILAWQ